MTPRLATLAAIALISAAVCLRVLWGLVFRENGARPGEPSWACVYCSDEKQAGPCFGPGRCFADPLFVDGEAVGV